ncbi:hypothetical protein DENSPDRAFT_356507 [Dentipellis sp. KUC8613]|nr:hypothetical protein DENSPDRAFT_356507 [Dentipellis sp. KUC8613]
MQSSQPERNDGRQKYGRVDRAVMRGYFKQGKSRAEIRSIFGCSADTVRRIIENQMNDNIEEDADWVFGAKSGTMKGEAVGEEDHMEVDEPVQGQGGRAARTKASARGRRYQPYKGADSSKDRKASNSSAVQTLPAPSQQCNSQSPKPIPSSSKRSKTSQSRKRAAPAPQDDVQQFLRMLDLSSDTHLEAFNAAGIRTEEDLASLKEMSQETLDTVLKDALVSKGFSVLEWMKLREALLKKA